MSDEQKFGEPPRPQMPEIKLPQVNGKMVRLGIGVLLALILVFTSFYTIDPEETGLVLRFGQYVRATPPGLHFKLPFGVERVLKVPIQRQLKEEFGFRTLRSGVQSQYSTKPYAEESSMLTGDLNAASVEWVVQYRIVNPYKFLFQVRNVEETFRDMSEAVMRRIVGDRTVNEVLTIGRAEVARMVSEGLQELCDKYETGIKVDQVVLQDVNPPDPVKSSFNEVNEAEQEMEKMINQAQSEYNREIPKAEGAALQTVQEAEGYALDRVNRAQGDAALFNAMYGAYALAPEVTRTRIYLETMTEILPHVENKIIVDSDLKGLVPLLNLSEGSPTAKGGK
ncbi:FtsH protease activity modulator HflK [bacterium CG17_big_fil_post_rev_8_21_14_2_50_64_8]|nr:MAG: FtsH protease activity modulator HflK [bacterium CG17_big_fil_post_rev_8_21_14_2_50_64_8]PJA73157.1 MAG: FtsH protease activity modulator HflK [bacterium CG_4_9_14_3_um_filter_65_15]